MLVVEKLTRNFGKFNALSDVSFSVDEGEIRGLIGPNGAGKTTLFNVISGVLRPSSGKVTYRGEIISGRMPNEICKKGLVRTFQIPRPFRSLSVLMNVALACEFGREEVSTRREAMKRAEEILDFVGWKKSVELLPDELTAVDLRRLELARALGASPTLLLADEILSGLTQEEIEEAIGILKRIREKKGITIIWIEHIMGAIMKVVDRVTVLSYGKIISEGKPEEVARDPVVLEAYLGEESME